jgi:Restriction endonuclease S subunits
MVETKFKQTEFGVIPEGWRESRLSDVLKDFTTGATPYRGIKDFYSGLIPWVSSGELNYNLIKDTNEHITEVARQKTNLKLYPAGTFLMAITGLEAEGTRGKCAILGTSATTNQSCLALSSTDKMIVEYWFYFYQYWSDWYAFRFSQGTKQQSYKADIVRKFPVIFPSDIKEQQRIAEALSNIDQLISSLSKTIEKKRLIKQGAMQQLLTGKKRLREFDGEWVESEIGTIVSIQRGSMLKSSEYQFGNIPVIAGGITPAGFHNVANRNGRTITISASGANAGYISYYKEPIFATDCSTISEGNDYFIDFIYYVLLLKQNDIFRLQTGGAQPHIHPKDIAPLKINIPCLYEEQVAIANILTTMNNEIESLEEEREKYIRLKEGMMQKLLTGQIRLVEAEMKQQTPPKAKTANVYFRRSVLAAEIADRLCEEPTFGHVKMEKLIFLTEHLCHIDIDSHYHRDAAGPYDNRALRSIDSQLKKQKWFEAKKMDKGYRYIPMQNRGGHKKYFDKHYADVMPMFEKIIDTFKSSPTEQCEIVATLYSAWDDLLQSHQPFTDDDILNEVLNNWHESKKRISRNRWQKELDWMRDNGFVPQNENR